MKILKIQNKKILPKSSYQNTSAKKRSKFENLAHFYAATYNQKTKGYEAQQLTHIYSMDENKKKQIEDKEIGKIKLPGFEVPSGVTKNYYTKLQNGKNITLKDPDIVVINKTITKEKAKKISFWKRFKKT